jgi:hypothetical protein
VSRWKGLGIVTVMVGVVTLAVVLRPRPQVVPQTASTTIGAINNRPPEHEVNPRPVASRTTSSNKAEPVASATPRPEPIAVTAASPTAPIAADSALPASMPAASAASAASGSVEPVNSPIVIAPATQAPPPVPSSRTAPVTVLLKKDTVIGIRIDQPISTDASHVDDKISAKVSRDVVVDGTTAIPAGTRVEGVITRVERPTAANPRGKLGIQFTTIVRADNTRVTIATDTIYREASDASSTSGASYDANAFSALVSGGRSFVPPSGSGRSAATSQSRPHDAQLPAGAPLTLHLTSSLSITVDRDPQ